MHCAISLALKTTKKKEEKCSSIILEMDKTWGNVYSHKCSNFIIIKLWGEKQT